MARKQEQKDNKPGKKSRERDRLTVKYQLLRHCKEVSQL